MMCACCNRLGITKFCLVGLDVCFAVFVIVCLLPLCLPAWVLAVVVVLLILVALSFEAGRQGLFLAFEKNRIQALPKGNQVSMGPLCFDHRSPIPRKTANEQY